MHAAFAVGVLTEILTDVKNGELELVGISGTSPERCVRACRELPMVR